MKLGALKVFQRMTLDGEPARAWLIAALHWRWSTTWRWSLSYEAPPGVWPVRLGASCDATHRGYPRQRRHIQASLHLPWLGSLHLATQPNTPKGATR